MLTMMKKMDRGNWIYLTSILICSLVILLPLYTADVYAVGYQDRMHDFSYSGSKGVDGYVSEYDEINITAKVEVEDREVTNNMLYYERVGGGSNYFARCQPDSNNQVYTCTTVHPVAIPGGSVDYIVRVIRDPTNPDSVISSLDRTFSMSVDSEKPHISVNHNRERTNLTVSYSFSDSGAGLYEYRVQIGDYDSGKQQIGSMSGNPVNQYENSTVIDISTWETGNYFIDIWVTDRMHGGMTDSKQTYREEIFISNEAPQIMDFNYSVNGGEIDYIRPNVGSEMDFVAYINETNVLESVVADFTQLGGDQESAQVSQEGGLYKCEWNNIHVNSTGSVRVEATNNNGLSSVSTFDTEYEVDDAAPVFNDVVSNHQYEGKNYLNGKNDTFIMHVVEAQSGMSQRKVFLNYEMVQSGASREQADRCVNVSESDWYCYWDDIDVSSATTFTPVVYVRETGESLKDDIGNKAYFSSNTTMYIDQISPDVKNISMFQELHHNYAVDGDSVILSADIDMLNTSKYEYESPIPEDNALCEVSNTNGSVNSSWLKADNCYQANGNQWKCNWTVEDVEATEGNVTVFFNIKDAAGNNATGLDNYTMRVFPLMTNDSHFGIITGSSMPEKIDRKVIGELEGEYNLFQEKTVEDLTGGCRVLDTELEGCQGPSGIDSSLYGIEMNKTSFFLRYSVSSIAQEYMNASLGNNELRFNCTYSVDGLCNEGYIEDEYVNESNTVQLYNSPLGDVSDALLDKVKSSVFLVDREWVDYVAMLTKILKYVENVCTFYEAMAAINELINSVSVAVYSVLSVGKAFGADVQPTWKSLRDFACDARHLLGGEKVKEMLYGDLEGIGDGDSYNVNEFGVLVDQDGNMKEGGGNIFMKRKITAACAFVTCAQCNPEMSQSWFKEGGGESDASGWQMLNPLSNARNSDQYLQSDAMGILDVLPDDMEEGMRQASMPSPEDSIITAASCYCLPAVLFHIRKMRQLECKYLYCVQSTSSIGAPITPCEEELKTDKCEYVWGAMLYALPMTNALAYFNDYMRQAVTHLPAVAINKIKQGVCPAFVAGERDICQSSLSELGYSAAVCGLAEAYMFSTTIETYVDNAMDFDALFAQLKVSDFCKEDDVEELIEEMREEDE